MTEDYEAGLREGRLKSLEDQQIKHAQRLDDHAKRLSSQERITYSLLGALSLLQIWPSVSAMLSNGQ